MFRKTLTANDRYPVPGCENLKSLIEMQLSFKPTRIADSFVQFPESTSNFKPFEKKIIVIATLFRKLQTVKDLVRPLSRKHRFRAPFGSQHVNGSQTLEKYDLNLIWKISPLLIY